MPDFSLLCAGLISIRQHDWKSSFYSVFSVFEKPTVSLSHWLFSVCTAARRRTPGSLSNASCALEKSRMACSHGNLSPKVKLTSNQHLQPLSFASCPSETSKVVPSHMLPRCVRDSSGGEESGAGERFLIKALQKLKLFFRHMQSDSSCDVLLKPHLPLIMRQLVSQPILLQWLCVTSTECTTTMFTHTKYSVFLEKHSIPAKLVTPLNII